eukprot:gene3700-4117_t
MTVGADVLVWQTFASVLCPGLVINRTVAFSVWAFKKANVSPLIRQWAPVAMGLGAIPFIVKPIDDLVDAVMDSTIRNYTGTKRIHLH